MERIAALASTTRIATPHEPVTNSECVYTFHSPYTTDGGIVVNLATFAGTLQELAFVNSPDDTALFLRIRKKRVTKNNLDEEQSKTEGVTKLGVGVEGGFQSDADKYETISNYSIVVLRKDANGDGKPRVVAELDYNEDTKGSFPEEVTRSADSIINHAGLAVQQDLKAWELDDEPKPVSKYAETLPFVDNGVKVSANPAEWKCEKTGEKTDHLWLNLSDGFIGGGRKNWDGSGGTNGALDHFIETGEKYPLVVKLGTITEDITTADCYSYAKDEDGPVLVPNLKELLEKRGIRLAGLQKTVKSTAELEVELNATYAFDAITEAGAHLVPIAGPGLHGLQNLGNSCYMNSVVQMLFSGLIPEISSRYGIKCSDISKSSLVSVSPAHASDDLLCQINKLVYGLTSGEFRGPIPESVEVSDISSSDPKYRLAPRMFKHVVGKDHIDFRTGQQQDAAQYFQYLLEKIDRAELCADGRLNIKNSSGCLHVTSHLFSYKTETRLVCEADHMIKYRQSPPETLLTLRIPMPQAKSDAPDLKRQRSEEPGEGGKEKNEVPTVSFDECLAAWSASTTIDDCRWPHLQNAVSRATSTTRFANFPRYLLVQMQRYQLGDDWQPHKIEVDIDVPEEISLKGLKGTGPQEGEILVPHEPEGSIVSATVQNTPAVDENALAQLMDMGFSMNGSKRALMAVGGSDVEAAMNWVFEHNSDPDFNDPLPDGDVAASVVSSDVDEGVVTSLVENLGCFTGDQVRAALKHCDGASDRAADWLFSHMDDLDAAIASLGINTSTNAPDNGAEKNSRPLDDGDGKYALIGLISHIGKNTSSGHYVCHLKKDGKWVIFNDEKVALSEHPPVKHAYMYLFQRSDSLGSPHPGF
ncbi:hypothetical protein ACHAWX_006432 [Stephanocyclus meneghinianus]